jgi:hypothetical protein
MSEKSKGWAISIGFYPGVLIGARTYHAEDMTSHVFYLPFFDVALQIER